MSRIIVVGDVHGCLDELTALLALVNYDKANGDRLIFLGDLLDRGPKSIEALRYVRELGVECVLGNHEEKHIRYAAHRAKQLAGGPKNPMRFDSVRQAEHEALTPEDLAWMKALPTYIRFEHDGRPWIATHAGVPMDKPIDQQDLRKLVRVRYLDRRSGAYATHRDGPSKVPEGSARWATLWKGPESVVYGHEAFNDVQMDVADEDGAVKCFGIDTGACFGGDLTAAVFVADPMPMVVMYRVPATKAYAQRLQVSE